MGIIQSFFGHYSVPAICKELMLSRELAFEYPKRGYFTMATRCEFYFLALLVDDVKDGFFFFFQTSCGAMKTFSSC